MICACECVCIIIGDVSLTSVHTLCATRGELNNNDNSGVESKLSKQDPGGFRAPDYAWITDIELCRAYACLRTLVVG